MKTKKYVTAVVLILLAFNAVNAQFLKKLKKAISGDEKVTPTQKLSDLDQKFADWDMGEADIIAISVFSNDFEKHRQKVGMVGPDGSFDLNMPDSLKTWIPVGVYGKDCDNSDEPQIVNPETKLAWNQLHVYQNGEYLGAIWPANPIKAAYNVNQSGVNNGTLGKYYLWVYTDGDGSATISCTKKRDITDGKEYTYENWPLKDHFDLHYKKGWNLVEVTNIDNIWVGLTKHYTERSWKVVDELPDDVTWVFRPRVENPSG